jgi:hypothetical protein
MAALRRHFVDSVFIGVLLSVATFGGLYVCG